MKSFKFKMPYNFNLFLIGDDHEGTLLRADKGWSRMCDMVNSEYQGVPEKSNFVIHHGDFMEGILIDDYRFDPFTSKSMFVTRQRSESKKNFTPIKDHLLVLLDGNHTKRLNKYGPITKDFCEVELERPEIFGTWSSHITYENYKGEVLFKHFVTHGAGTINSVAGDAEQRAANEKVLLKRRLRDKFGDTLLNSMGHTHKLIVCEPLGSSKLKTKLFLTVNKSGSIEQKYTRVEKTDGYIHEDFKWFVNTGSFYRNYKEQPEGMEFSGYAEEKNYDPLQNGFAVVVVRDGKIQEIVPEVI